MLDGSGVAALLIDDGATTEEGHTVEVGWMDDVGPGKTGEEKAMEVTPTAEDEEEGAVAAAEEADAAENDTVAEDELPPDGAIGAPPSTRSAQLYTKSELGGDSTMPTPVWLRYPPYPNMNCTPTSNKSPPVKPSSPVAYMLMTGLGPYK